MGHLSYGTLVFGCRKTVFFSRIAVTQDNDGDCTFKSDLRQKRAFDICATELDMHIMGVALGGAPATVSFVNALSRPRCNRPRLGSFMYLINLKLTGLDREPAGFYVTATSGSERFPQNERAKSYAAYIIHFKSKICVPFSPCCYVQKKIELMPRQIKLQFGLGSVKPLRLSWLVD